jgi:hypothetical protein
MHVTTICIVVFKYSIQTRVRQSAEEEKEKGRVGFRCLEGERASGSQE